MRLTSRAERNAPTQSADDNALDRIREWTHAAEMDGDEESVRLFTDAAREAATPQLREY